MIRSPLNYPMSGSADADGAAELQTDVMRFMAILSLCLVAIFALVQSIPPSPVPPETAERAKPESVPESTAARPGPERPMQPEPDRPVSVAKPAPSLPAAAKPPAPSPPAPVATPDEGFTLRFESGDALRRLVARGEVGFYAIRDNEAKRMNVSRGRASFWPASLPAQYHEMDERTVPADVESALRNSGTAAVVTWGVTLPSTLSRELKGYLNTGTDGDLVIGADGSLRLEQEDE